ncbi:MAG: hypothetical protein WD738_23080 [Pirellulales bacterium]
MSRSMRLAIAATVFAVLSTMGTRAEAGTIIKLSLGGDAAADIEYVGGLVDILSTTDDSIPGTTGDQNTAVEYLDFLDGVAADVLTSTASVTLDGLTAAGPAIVFGGTLVLQNFAGGTLELYDPSNTLLLSGALSTSALTGPLGPPATGGLFTTSFSLVTGGTLAPYIDPGSLTLSMSLSDINGGAGLSVTPSPPIPPLPPPGIAFGILDPFVADATVSIAGEIPEPFTSTLLLLCGATAALAGRSRRRL